MRQAVRSIMLALYFAVAPSEHESMWTHLDSRPVAILPVGEPTPALVGLRVERLCLESGVPHL